jgi:hypothetical protein
LVEEEKERENGVGVIFAEIFLDNILFENIPVLKLDLP